MLVDKIVIKEEKSENCFQVIEIQLKIIPFRLFFYTKKLEFVGLLLIVWYN